MNSFQFNEHTISFTDRKQSILEAIEEHGLYVPSSCLSGRCNFCLLQLEKGSVNESSQYGLSEKQLKKRLFKSCVAKVENNINCNDRFHFKQVEK